MQAPEHITVLNSSGAKVAFLSPDDGLTNCRIDVALNGRSELAFRLPASSPKQSELQPEGTILAGGREFTLSAPSAINLVRDGRSIWVEVTAPETWTLLAKVFVTVANDSEPTPPWGTVSILASDAGQGSFSPGSAGSALYRLLQAGATGWTVGAVDVGGVFDLETERETLLANIERIRAVWGGYLVWDSLNKIVHLRDNGLWAQGTGVRIEYAKNMAGMTRELDSDLVTRLYPFGVDNLTVASVNAGQLYVDDNGYTATVYEGIFQDQSIGDPATLLAKAQEYLAEYSRPRARYQIRTVDLSALPEWAHEEMMLGDIVRVIDSELGIDVEARIVRHQYQVFEPWKAEFEIARPSRNAWDQVSSASRQADFVQRVLRPNPSSSNLLSGLVNAFATTIKSANGRLRWSDDALIAEEIDGFGAPTGLQVRITPGGIGISTDFGATFATAITGEGILANAIVVSNLYALSSDDGYTRMSGDGIHVYDDTSPTPVERVHMGRWLDGVYKYGIRIFSETGTTIIDDSGILQTWVNPGPSGGELDSLHPVTMDLYLPTETMKIERALLRFRLKNFRATSTGAASGGGTTSGPSSSTTTASGGGTTSGPSSITTTASGGGTVVTTGIESVDFGNIAALSTIIQDNNTAAHGHGGFGGSGQFAPDGTTFYDTGNIIRAWYNYSGDTHFHGQYTHRHSFTDPVHTHGMNHTHENPAHTHGMNHTHENPAHTHPMVYGIFEDTLPTNVRIFINGVNRTVVFGGPFNTDQFMLDIKAYLNIGYNEIRFESDTRGRIDASVFIQTFQQI